MTPDERCLTRACEAFIGRQGDHEFGELVAAAVALRAARHRPAAVEAWEDGPCGVGLSDKADPAPRKPCVRCGKTDANCFGTDEYGHCETQRCSWARADASLLLQNAASRPPAAEEPSGRAAEAQDGRGGSDEPETTLGWKSHAATLNPAPIAPEPGERRPLPLYDCQGDGE